MGDFRTNPRQPRDDSVDISAGGAALGCANGRVSGGVAGRGLAVAIKHAANFERNAVRVRVDVDDLGGRCGVDVA